MDKKPEENNTKIQEKFQEKRPNEIGGYYFSSMVKISDPKTKEILVQIRGDN